MRVSKMGMKNVKLSNLDEMYPVQDILLQTNQVKQYGSGVYAYDNVPLKVQDNIEEIIKALEKAKTDYFHIDVMDGDFVPSISFGMPVIKSIRKE